MENWFFYFVIGFGFGVFSVYFALLLQVTVFLIPIRYLQALYYKMLASATAKMNSAKMEAELNKIESDVLSKRRAK